MHTPNIGERYRDTAQAITNITHLDRFRASRARDAEREELLMQRLILKAQRLDATVAQLEAARTAGNQQLARDRSLAYALTIAEQHLPKPKRSDGHV
jgi:hypothetical protein